jgi:gas vesicle protein
MANGYDRYMNDGNSGGSFVLGLVTGAAIGVGLGMLFAPKAGSELRDQLSEQAGNLANQASEGYKRAAESASEWADRGRDMYGKAREAVSKGANEAERQIRNTSSQVNDAVADYAEKNTGSTYGSPVGAGSPGPTRRS